MSKIEKIFNTQYSLGEAQYSGRKKRVTVFYTFLSRIEIILKYKLG
jgi:hypothetical protein